MEDIVLKIDNQRFNYRVAILPYNEKGQVLLQNAKKDNYISLLGGRVKLGESTQVAIKREVEEEIGKFIDVKKLELVYVCENFFEYNDKNFHELLFVYKYKLDTCESFKIIDKEDVSADWYEISNLKELNIKPEFIKSFDLSQPLKHINVGG